MALTPRTHIGPYEIVGSLGAGGMGEVYRGRDTRLNRDVALKIVPETFALDADRLARFQREAQVLASLSHPNIAAIYGLEDSAAGKALVLELVEGETLADRIARGPIPLDEALPLARQIAEALESAHEQGVVHRDLKPANIKVRDDGTLKVLDFGLAKMLENEAAAGSSSALSLSPTITTPAMTQVGMILGTAAYMSPEQARGKPADRRSDVWAFGCVLFEMLTGTQAFAGEDVTDVIAAVVRGEPSWQALPADTPAPVRLLLQRCLEKDRRKRIGDISGVLFVLREPSLGVAAAAPVTSALAPAETGRSWKRVAMAAGALLLVGAVSAGVGWTLKRTAPPQVSRLVMVTGTHQIARAIPGQHIAISPDGSTVLYIAAVDGVPTMFARRIDAFEPVLLAPAALAPFFRPDGKEVGYYSQGAIRRVSITGGPSVEVLRVEGPFRGATWGRDGNIVFATATPTTGLMRVNAAGGKPEMLTTPEALFDHVLPRFLPDGDVLFTIVNAVGTGASHVAVLDMRSSPPQTKVLVSGGSDAYYLPSGHLLYLAGESIRIVDFDLSRLEVGDMPPTAILSGVAISAFGLFADFAFSESGTAVYLQATAPSAAARSLAFVDRNGRPQAVSATPRSYLYPRLSPDGTRVAVDIREDDNDIWVWDLRRGGFTKVTQHLGQDRTPVWADNDHLYFSGEIDGTPTVYRQRADGTGQPQKVTDGLPAEPLFPLSVTQDRLIVATTSGGIAFAKLFTLAVPLVSAEGAPRSTSTAPALPKVESLVAGPGGAINGIVSPDGRWLAYESNESGTWEVYVRPFGAGASGPRQTVSTMGGIQPRWSANSQELFYVSPRSEMMVVKIEPGNTWSASPPARLFDAREYFFGTTTGTPFWMYDITSDGRFLMVKSPEVSNGPRPADHIYVIQNWGEELKQRAGR